MVLSYAIAATFVLPRLPLPIPNYENLSLDGTGYSLRVATLFALLVAE